MLRGDQFEIQAIFITIKFSGFDLNLYIVINHYFIKKYLFNPLA
jgi:hypothetical protein